MAALIGRASREALLKVPATAQPQNVRNFSFKNLSNKKKMVLGALGTIATGGVTFAVALNTSVLANDAVHPPKYPWSQLGKFKTHDHDSLRRGYEVYKQVCAACHSMDFLFYREMVGVIFSDKEAKKEAAEQTFVDGPNQEGEMFERPGKLTDAMPRPYANKNAARNANNGAEPPDLTYIIRGRHSGQDYIFSLLTGYREAPAGIVLGEGQHYNPYFPGGAISMAQALYNEIIEYEDGTPATQSQLAKDVVTFLTWAGEPEHDQRKRYGVKALSLLGFLIVCAFYYKKHKFSYLKTRISKLKK